MVSVLRKFSSLIYIDVGKRTMLIIPSEKQLTKRLKRWNFRKNKSRKKNESLSKVLVDIQHRRRLESADTHTNNRNICESNGEIDMELQHVGARFQPNPILGML